MNTNEKDMIKAIYQRRGYLSATYEVAIPNCFTQHDNEADLFFIRKSGFCDEIEIKVSRSDFLADKKKRVYYRNLDYSEFNWSKNGHEFCPSTKPKYEALQDGLMVNYFWFAIKEGVADVDEIPKFAGLIVVKPDGELNVIKQPKRLHRNKLDFEQRYKFSRLLDYRYWRLIA